MNQSVGNNNKHSGLSPYTNHVLPRGSIVFKRRAVGAVVSLW